MKQLTIGLYLEQEIHYFRMKRHLVERLRKTFPEITFLWCRSEASFQRALPGMDVVLANTFKNEWFPRAKQLRFMLSPAAGRDVMGAAPPSHIQAYYCTFHGEFIAETVLGLMLGVNRGILQSYKHQLANELWPWRPLCEPGAIRLLRGSHAVIIGFGHIGEWIARLLKPFGIRITGVRRNPPTKRPAYFAEGDSIVPVSQLDKVLPTADHVILALPNDTGTDNLLGARLLKKMSSHAVIYNIGRGNCIDEAALAKALKTRAIAGACLDVFTQEPLRKGHPLAQNLPGLIRMPHASAFADEYMERYTDEIIPVIRNWLKQTNEKKQKSSGFRREN
jgi:phosphoglycerate dehydrogenase-like enzyme